MTVVFLNFDLCFIEASEDFCLLRVCLSITCLSSILMGELERLSRLKNISLGVKLLWRIRELMFFSTNAKSVGVIGPVECFKRRISFCISLTKFPLGLLLAKRSVLATLLGHNYVDFVLKGQLYLSFWFRFADGSWRHCLTGAIEICISN